MSAQQLTENEARICIVANSGRATILIKRLMSNGFRGLTVVRGGDALLEQLRQSANPEARRQPMGRRLEALEPVEAAFDVIFLTEVLSQEDLTDLTRLLNGGELGWMGVIVVLDGEPPDPERGALLRRLGALDIFALNGPWSELVSRLLLVSGLVEERRQRHQMVDRYRAEISQRKVLETRLRYQVMHDELTGLINYRNLEQRMENATLHARQYVRTNGLIYLNLGQFKLVNDIEGHEAGNQVLVMVANKLRSEVDNSAVLARIGSDEFVVLLENTSESRVQQAALLLHQKINEIVYVGKDNTYHATASMGIALQTPESAENAQKFFANAKQACRLARQRGRNSIYRFDPRDDGIKILEQDLKWAQKIRDALTNDQFFLVFQPVINLEKNRITHAEALIRMRGPGGETISPAQFIPVAERMGLIHQIDLWVVEHTLDLIGRLHDSYAHVSFGLNLSTHAFECPDLLPLIERKLEQHWIDPGRIVFEITETAAITSVAETRRMLARLRGLGCRFALDDFGSGFASFSYLKNFPVDVLKIDGSFIVNLPSDPMDQMLVRSMVDVAHNLNKQVIAEFVEKQEVVDMLRDYGIDYAQGYLFGKPEQEMQALLRPVVIPPAVRQSVARGREEASAFESDLAFSAELQ